MFGVSRKMTASQGINLMNGLTYEQVSGLGSWKGGPVGEGIPGSVPLKGTYCPWPLLLSGIFFDFSDLWLLQG